MISQNVKTIYKCSKVTLNSGVSVSASEYTVKDGKISHINGNIHYNDTPDEPLHYMDGSFSASLNNDKYQYAANGIDSSINILAVIMEFIEFLLDDIKTN